MQNFKLYLANSHGQKLSGYTAVEAVSLPLAKAKFRRQLDAKGVTRDNEILCEFGA